MAFLNILKKKQKERKKEILKQREESETQKLEASKAKKKVEAAVKKVESVKKAKLPEAKEQKRGGKSYKAKKISESEVAWKVLQHPYISEKASNLVKENQYIFRVFSEANKVEIKKAIEDVYGVDVEEVKIVKIPSKKRRLGRIEGTKSGFKKAIVKIKQGQIIEVLPR